MLLNRQQLAMSLCQLVETDYHLSNHIISEYVNMIDDRTFDALEAHVNNNLNELMWGLYHQLNQDYERIVNNNVGAIPTNPINYYRVLSFCDYLTKPLDSML